MGSVKAGIEKYDDLKRDMERMQKAPKKVVENTVKDFKKRAPSWVSQEVAKEYNIKKAAVKPNKYGNGEVGSVKTAGETVASVSLTYKGRVLTPVHFGMTPKMPKEAYTLKAQIKRGQKKTLGKVKKLTKKQRANIGKNFTGKSTRDSDKSPIMLMPTGSTYIPFQRQSRNRKDVKVIKTISLPQMVSNPKVEENIYKAISEKLGKRFEHYVDRYMGE